MYVCVRVRAGAEVCVLILINQQELIEARMAHSLSLLGDRVVSAAAGGGGRIPLVEPLGWRVVGRPGVLPPHPALHLHSRRGLRAGPCVVGPGLVSTGLPPRHPAPPLLIFCRFFFSF